MRAAWWTCEPGGDTRTRNTERSLLAGVCASETAPRSEEMRGRGDRVELLESARALSARAVGLPAALCLKAGHSGVHAFQDGLKVINPHADRQATLTGEPVRHRLRDRWRLLSRSAGCSTWFRARLPPSSQGRRCLSRRGKERVRRVPGRRRSWRHGTRHRQRPRAGSRGCGPRRGVK